MKMSKVDKESPTKCFLRHDFEDLILEVSDSVKQEFFR